MASPLK